MRYRKYIIGMIIIAFTVLSSGCLGSSFTKEQAIQTVKEYHEKDSAFGKISIVSVTHKGGEYMIKWERKRNCEGGTDYVSDRSGKITHGKSFIC